MERPAAWAGIWLESESSEERERPCGQGLWLRERGSRGVPISRASRTIKRLGQAVGLLLSRDVAVLTNAIAFNFLLCLFPLVIVLAAAS